ncbi:hypothetical protein BJ508DRAFT_82547 [Ascobolus immersus RN42]|uniref:Uncharacterized protein n=1 Tax=Ascobolus immersus RN42 TaxID=1160509 RepID=A0A3N4HI67_ASCIM|nr:hypothetical protein BJ508DRAFT_82547 [Ascobolus immersus RN42]
MPIISLISRTSKSHDCYLFVVVPFLRMQEAVVLQSREECDTAHSLTIPSSQQDALMNGSTEISSNLTMETSSIVFRSSNVDADQENDWWLDPAGLRWKLRKIQRKAGAVEPYGQHRRTVPYNPPRPSGTTIAKSSGPQTNTDYRRDLEIQWQRLMKGQSRPIEVRLNPCAKVFVPRSVPPALTFQNQTASYPRCFAFIGLVLLYTGPPQQLHLESNLQCHLARPRNSSLLFPISPECYLLL